MHKKIISTLSLGLLLASTTISANANQKLSDADGHWASKEIQDFISRGYINGYEDGTFKPDNSITRAEFVKIANNYFGFKNKGNEEFSDVNSNDWFYNDICIAQKEGYINGYGDGSFKPDKTITREEAAKIITSIKNREDIDIDKINNFSDGYMVSDWAKKYVEGAIESGYMKGDTNGKINPISNITRAESVSMISRVNLNEAPNTKPVLTLAQDRFELNVGDTWNNNKIGASATDKEDGKLEVKYEGNVDTSKAGEYTVTVSVTDSKGETVSAIAKVIVKEKEVVPPVKPEVINSVPVIGVTNITTTINNEDLGQFFTATDKEDGDISNKIEWFPEDSIKVGTNKILVTVTDSQGAKASKVVEMELTAVAPTMTAENVTLKEGDKFDVAMTKAVAEDCEGSDISKYVKVVEGEVNTDKAGTYNVILGVTDKWGLKSSKEVTVTVEKALVEVNEAPVINCADVHTMSPGDKFDVEMIGATATDKEDGDLTHKINLTHNVKDEIGTYKATLSVTDSDGKTTTKEITVKVIKRNEAPVIHVADTFELTAGDKFDYSMLQAAATDDYDGDLTDRIQYQGNVDTSRPGTYRVSVYVADSKDMIGQKWVTVTVKEAPNEDPTITADNITIDQDSKFDYSMLNAKATDKEDGDLTNKITYKGLVKTAVPKTYTVTCSVEDSKGRPASVVVIVTVKEKAESNLVEKLNSSAFQSQVRAEMVSLVNAHRQANGLKPYVETEAMNSVATAWSKHMAELGFCDHVDPNGQTSQDLTGETHALENILMIGAGESTTPQQLANNMLNMWRNSPGHNNAMLNDMQNEMGFGYYATQDSYGNINIYATQEFNINWDVPNAPTDN